MLGSSEVAINLRSSVGQEQIVHHGNECLKRQLARRGVAFEDFKARRRRLELSPNLGDGRDQAD
jgi:hypothetical protein